MEKEADNFDRFEEAAEALTKQERSGGGRKSRKGGFGLEKKGKKVKEKLNIEAREGSEELKIAEKVIAEKILKIINSEPNPARHRGIRDYFEWVRYGLLALNEEGQKQEIMKDGDLRTKFVRSAGAGGQNVNKTSTAVSMRHIPTGFFLKEMGTRSQVDNLEMARQRMFGKLESHLKAWERVIGKDVADDVLATKLGVAIEVTNVEAKGRTVLEEIRERLNKGINL